MKLSIDTDIDALYLTFSDNKVTETIQLELEINVDVDSNNKVVGLEVLHYSKLKEWVNELLKENDLPILEDTEIPFYMHQGYEAVWFRKEDADKEDIVCTYYLEGDKMDRFILREYLQDQVNFELFHRRLGFNIK